MSAIRQDCVRCGRPIAADHNGGVCSPCIVALRDYDPHHDPDFADRLLALLIENKGQAVNVYQALGIRSCGDLAWRCVWVHIKRFRRHGYCIEGSPGRYRYLGMDDRGNGCASRDRSG